MGVKTYNPKNVIVIVGGAQISGYAKGTFVKVSRDEDAFEKYVGADGQTSRSQNQNIGGKVEITLARTSASNDYLSSLAAADAASGQGVVPVIVKDINGTTLHTATAAWIKKLSDDESAKEVTERTWPIDCADLSMNPGGNNTQGI